MKKIVLIIFILLLFPLHVYAVELGNTYSNAVLIYDITDDKILQEKNSEEKKYVASLTYSYENKGYDTILIKYSDEENDNDKKDEKEEIKVKPFYTKLVKANLFEDQTIELQEKVIYTKVSKEKDLYTIKVYGDLHYHNLIDTRNNLTESQMQNSIFNLNEYMNEASTVTYTFKTENDKYYFYSSNVTNK